MKSICSIVFLLIVSTANAAAPCAQEAGNYYCEQADTITYSNFGSQGTYQKITSMSNGKCSSSPTTFSSGPLNEEISWHFRGPLRLKQFAFYTPGGASIHRRHGHLHRHIHGRGGEELQADALDIAVAKPTTMSTMTHTATSSRTSGNAPSSSSVSGSWSRQGYYNAAQKSASGLVFLNNKGGQGSGVWDATWGNSLSYASSDALTGSRSPQVLADTMLADNTEVAIFTSKSCTDTSSSSCGVFRPGTVAYHGFNGPSKLFLLEFSMPLTGKKGFNADMPAAWILNAQIPRTMQYGPKECSCWASGCGEWDIFEVLNSGNTKCKSTFHGAPSKSGGDSNWFARPTGKTVKVAVWFDGAGKKGVISVLPDNTEFEQGISEAKLQGWISGVAASKKKTFPLPV